MAHNSLLDNILRLISDEECSSLTRIPDMDEVFEALQSMPLGMSAGPNRFPITFYCATWEIIKEDLLV